MSGRMKSYNTTMKRFILFIVCWWPLAVQATTVGEVTATTTRMKPATLQKRFLLKPGDPFKPMSYERAQEELHKLRVFKKLDFSTHPHDDKIDIHIAAEDGYYFFPIGFAMGGSKSAAGLSVAAGNVFKQGETTFLFAGGSKDGWTAQVGVSTPQHFVLVNYTRVDLDPRFYQNHWYNIPSVFSTSDDTKHHGEKLLREIKGTQEQVGFVYKHRLSRTLRLAVRPQYNYISYKHHAVDSGNHHQLAVGLEWEDDIRPGTNMGALSGYGLTDKKQSLLDLPRPRSGYKGAVSYANGGKWTGSDYHVSKLVLEGAWLLELKTRHLLMLQLCAQEAFEYSFSEQVTSGDLLNSIGRYDRERRGKRGAGANVSFTYYVLRNETGLLSLTPFYQLAYVDAGSRYLPHSGAGATLSYKLWRFPLPFGINYTQNLQDGAHQVGFVIGGAF